MPDVTILEYGAAWQEIRSTSRDWEQAGSETLLKILQHMHLIRAFEEVLQELGGEGAVHGPVHSSVGQEGGAVGSMVDLRVSDQINGTHRAHHHFLAKALRYVDTGDYDPRRKVACGSIAALIQRTMAEIMGLAQGFSRGRGGSMHLRWPDAGVFGTNATVGGGVPLATGVAWSRKRQGERDVVVTYFGDGAINEGAVHESLNLASLWQIPICFFIENNQYAVSTTLKESVHEPRLSARAAGYGIPAFRVDGMDAIAVRLAMDNALKIMRSGDGPTVIEAEVYRYLHHSGPFPASALRYRTKDEEVEWVARDPIDRVTKEMVGRNWLTEAEAAAMRQGALQVVNAAADNLTERNGKLRAVIPSLWPQLRTKVAFLTGYGSQHSMDPAGLYANWPGWRILAPSTPFDYVGLMNSALLCEDPVLVIEHVNLYEAVGPTPVDDLDYCIPFGKAKVVRLGNTFTVLTYLAVTRLAVEAADQMGLDVEVVDLRSLDRAGLDWETIGESIRKTNNVIVVEQGPLTTSYGSMLGDEIQRRFFDYLDQPVKRLHGGEASPTVSKVLERAAVVGIEEIRSGYADMMKDMGQALAAAE